MEDLVNNLKSSFKEAFNKLSWLDNEEQLPKMVTFKTTDANGNSVGNCLLGILDDIDNKYYFVEIDESGKIISEESIIYHLCTKTLES